MCVFSMSAFGQKTIKLNREGGVFKLPCKVNGIEMQFIFDTGASLVSISLKEALFLFKNGLISENDNLGKSKFRDATGNISEGRIINLRKINIDGILLFNVKASVVNSMDAPLLLGQNVLMELGRITFDPNSATLTLLDFGNNTENAQKLTESGIDKIDLGNYKGAIKDFNQAIELAPDYMYAYFNRAIAKERLDDKSGAILDYTKAINIEPWSESYFYRAGVFLDSGLFKKALEDINMAIRFSKNDPDYYNLRAWVKMNLAELLTDPLLQEAIDDLTIAISLDPKDGDCYFTRGMCKYRSLGFLTACEDFLKAKSLGKEIPPDILLELSECQ